MNEELKRHREVLWAGYKVLKSLHNKPYDHKQKMDTFDFYITLTDRLLEPSESVNDILERQFGVVLRECGVTEGVIDNLKANARQELRLRLLKNCSVERMGKYLYENPPECFSAIAKEKRAEASYDIAKAIFKAIVD